MFRKKKVEESPALRKVRQISDELSECYDDLQICAQMCYMANAAMTCYIPAEPDWMAQGERCRDYQEKLRVIIGHYDSLRNEMVTLIEKESVEWRIPMESHAAVEWALRKILKH